jgi:ABC-type Mn2+/Zn2+ transport system ATPase subunit
MKPLTIEPLMDFEVQNLSGGELQRVALALCLGQPADIYLIDEPSAYLDSEQRILAAKVRPAWQQHTQGLTMRRAWLFAWRRLHTGGTCWQNTCLCTGSRCVFIW